MLPGDDNVGHGRTRFSRRAALIGLGQVGVFGALAARLYQLQVTDANRYALLAEENRISTEILAPERGRILDRAGKVLASNTEGFRAVVVPALARDLKAVLKRFHEIVPLSVEETDRILARARRQSSNIAIVLINDLSWERLAEINLHAPLLPGVRTEPAGQRTYIRGSSMGHILGYVGPVERRAMNDNPMLRLPGMRVGRAGVERGLEDALRGHSGRVSSEVDARGRVMRIIDTVEPKAGRDQTLTIDTELQEQVMVELGKHRRASSVVLSVATGEVLALASSPGFDPNVVASAGDGAEWALLQAAPDDPLNNRAIRGLYPPGSTFKMVTALAGLEAGKIDLKERLPCEGHYEYYGHTYRCWRRSGHESSDLHKALRESCDCYFYEVARRTGIEAIAAMARKLGCGVLHDAGIAGAKSGLIPDHDWKRGRFGRGWLGGETILASIGQGYVLTTPLQLATMTARLASGLDISPSLVKREGAAASLSLNPTHLSAVRRGMTAVVNEDGGTGARASGEEGDYMLAGKTGTAQVSSLSRDAVQTNLPWHKRDHALFVAYAPVSQPRYAIATVIEHGGGGGAVAAPASRAIMDLVMARDPLRQPSTQPVPATALRPNGPVAVTRPSGDG
jgi:penicillin-binding protein 2